MIIESLFFGTPVIAFRSGGPLEIIKSKDYGLLAKDENQFIRYVINFKRYKFTPKILYNYVKENYSIENMMRLIK